MKKRIIFFAASMLSLTLLCSCASQKTSNTDQASSEKKEVKESKREKECSGRKTGTRLKRC